MIELVVVIAILGILAMIAIPRLSGFTNEAKLKANENSLATIQGVVNVYIAENGAVPTQAQLKVDKFLGTTLPKGPKITTYTTKGAYDAATGDYFVMDTSGYVTIGTTGVQLSTVAN